MLISSSLNLLAIYELVPRSDEILLFVVCLTWSFIDVHCLTGC